MSIITPDNSPLAIPYTDIELTEAINELPVVFGQVLADGFFPDDPLASPYFAIDIENDVVSALPVTDDGPATIARHGTGAEKIFKVPRIEHQDDVRSADIRGWLQLSGRSRDPQTLADLVNRRLTTFKRKFTLTHEVMAMSALKGVVVDGAGKTIVDLFAAFEISKKIVYFDFGNTSSTDGHIQAACDAVWQLITQDLSDETMTGIRAKVSRAFFNLLINHPEVKQYWLQAEQALQLVNVARGRDGQYRPRSFMFGNITFEENSAVAPMWGGTNTLMVAATKGHAFPDGTMDTHKTYVAPPDDIRELDGGAANLGDKIHITTEMMKHGKGVEMLGQMSALPFWRRPKLLVELDSGSGSSTTPTGY